MKFFRHIADLATLMQLPKDQRRIIFYSEGQTYWPYLEGVLSTFLQISTIPVCYISSQVNDPGLALQHPRLRSFLIDESWLRNWLFANIDTEVMVMTMPDLQNYQVKRSKSPVHYVYIHHALVSSHMVYRPHAFDHYDSIFCAGPHHIQEIKALEKKYQLTAKNLLAHGYGRLDTILDQRQTTLQTPAPKSMLIAPSWGPNGLIETVGDHIVNHLLAHEYSVILRPHPQTLKFAKKKLNKIIAQHQNNPLFTLETNVTSQNSLHQSTLMISDWSGAAIDYAFGLEKPVLFIDVPRKINNPDYQSIDIVPFEVFIRGQIGGIVPLNQIDSLSTYIQDITQQTDWQPKLAKLREAHTFNVQNSGKIGAQALMDLLK